VAERPLTVVVADDHPVVRRGLRQLFDAEGDIEVVAEAGDAETARRYVHGHHPDVLVIDLNMPGEPTLDVIPRIREQFPDTQIVVLTMQNEPAYARLAFSLGVLGYVLKEAADDELVHAVRAAARGDSFLNPRLGAKVAIERPPNPPDGLSKRELEVLQLIAPGYTNVQIAADLSLSVRTIETHRGPGTGPSLRGIARPWEHGRLKPIARATLPGRSTWGIGAIRGAIGRGSQDVRDRASAQATDRAVAPIQAAQIAE
jgi:two-component system response regulator NreC